MSNVSDHEIQYKVSNVSEIQVQWTRVLAETLMLCFIRPITFVNVSQSDLTHDTLPFSYSSTLTHKLCFRNKRDPLYSLDIPVLE